MILMKSFGEEMKIIVRFQYTWTTFFLTKIILHFLSSLLYLANWNEKNSYRLYKLTKVVLIQYYPLYTYNTLDDKTYKILNSYRDHHFHN